MPLLLLLSLPLLFAGFALSLPTSDCNCTMSDKAIVSPLSSTEVAKFTAFTYYAATAYCEPVRTLRWDCGLNCAANPHFLTISAGGNGGTNQFWFVGFDPHLDTVIVSHQGTDYMDLRADITDIDFFKEPLDRSRFPNVIEEVEVHGGFQDAHAMAAPEVLDAVKKTLDIFGTRQVTMVGHSLGGALALLDSIFLPLHLPKNISFSTYAYGVPRVGNQAFADYIDANTSLIRVNNRADPIPVVPPQFLGFIHPSGEVHITNTGDWVPCRGQDSEEENCILAEVPSMFSGEVGDHIGPYNGVMIDCNDGPL